MDEKICDGFSCVFVSANGHCVDGQPCDPKSCGGPSCFDCEFKNDCARDGGK